MKSEKGMLICKTETGLEFGVKEFQYKEYGQDLIDEVVRSVRICTDEAPFVTVQVNCNGKIIHHNV